MRLLRLVKQAGVEAMEAGYPVSVLTGSVLNINPLEVSLDPQREPLVEDFLIVPESMTAYRTDLKHTHGYNDGLTGETLSEPLVIRRGLEVGDIVLLLRVQGGKQFVILDRVV